MNYPIIGNLNPRTHGPIANWYWQLPNLRKMGCDYAWINPEREETELTVPNAGTGSIYAVKNYKKMSSSFSNLTAEQRTHMSDEEIASADRKALKDFAAAADRQNIKLLGDLVFTIIARDNDEVHKEEQFLKELITGNAGKHFIRATWREEILNERMPASDERKTTSFLNTVIYHDDALNKDMEYHVRFKRTCNFNRPPGNTALYTGGAPHEWPDVAFVNYGEPKPEDPSSCIVANYFIDTLWRDSVHSYLDAGFKGFRCDVAYEVPPYVWQKLIEDTRREEYKNVLWFAETLGDDINPKIERLGKARIYDEKGCRRPAFDYTLNSASWLPDDFAKRPPSWFTRQKHLLQHISIGGGIGFVDSHDHEPYASHIIKKLSPEVRSGALSFEAAAERIGPAGRKQLADAVVARHAHIASVSNGLIVMNGTQYCCPYQPTVFKTGDTGYWNRWMEIVKHYPELDVSDRIAAINHTMAEKKQKAAGIRVG